MNHCCYEMESAIRDDTMVYNSPRRLYACYIDKSVFTLQFIRFCPFCGKVLPEDLVDEYDCAIYERLGQDGLDLIATNRSFICSSNLLPPEFQTDEWWKKRGL